MQIRSVGIDLGKTTFHLVALGDNGKVLLKKKFTQKQLIAFTANMQTCLRSGPFLWQNNDVIGSAPTKKSRPASEGSMSPCRLRFHRCLRFSTCFYTSLQSAHLLACSWPYSWPR